MYSYLDHIYPVGFAFNSWHQILGVVPKGAARGQNRGHLYNMIDAMIHFLLGYILKSTKSFQKAFILKHSYLNSRYPVSVRLLGPCVGVWLEVKN